VKHAIAMAFLLLAVIPNFRSLLDSSSSLSSLSGSADYLENVVTNPYKFAYAFICMNHASNLALLPSKAGYFTALLYDPNSIINPNLKSNPFLTSKCVGRLENFYYE
jgi:hypothetical protein